MTAQLPKITIAPIADLWSIIRFQTLHQVLAQLEESKRD